MLFRSREQWDGKDRWIRYAYTKKAKLVSVEIDPDHKIYIDRNNLNNSSLLEGDGKPARKLANYWNFLTQMLAQLLAWWLV